MLVLHTLIHSLAKEEKRLYNLHGRKSRFVHIYEGYLQQSDYDKSLDRTIFAKEYSAFSRAFYSMQKNALLEDVLSVLLEYSNSSLPAFKLSRNNSKYEVLMHKGFYSLGVDYLKQSIKIARKGGFEEDLVFLLRRFLQTLPLSKNADFKDFGEAHNELVKLENKLRGEREYSILRNQLSVLIKSCVTSAQIEENRGLAGSILRQFKDYIGERPAEKPLIDLLRLEYDFSEKFEDKLQLHKRLITLEKQYNKEDYDGQIRLKLVNHLMESCMDVGDFLLINGLIYKTERQLEGQKNLSGNKEYLNFVFLSGMYYFYENEITESQQQFKLLTSNSEIGDEEMKSHHYTLAAIQIAANLPQATRETLDALINMYPRESKKIPYKILSLISLIESSQTESAISFVSRIKNSIKTSSVPRKFSGERQFLDFTLKILRKKKVRFSSISYLETHWRQPLKLNLWLKAKVENNFYYNHILSYWQERKKVI